MRKICLSMLAISVLALTACNDSDDKVVQPIENISEPTLVSFAKLDVETYAEGPDSGKDVRGANG
ncbi:hypothetical protein NL389_35575, partial [Klebsiella pneumoniae]|nr:hypothetical protein [Klebsiella pneumoniae]